jgi:hypothetical protein
MAQVIGAEHVLEVSKSVNDLAPKLDKIVVSMDRASKSSECLAKALNLLTLCGVIISGLTLTWSIIQFFIVRGNMSGCPLSRA